jgi:DNA-binding XRE family transcriptional regulator
MPRNQIRNAAAGRLIRELRINAGHSPQGLSDAIYLAGLKPVSAATIRRIEDLGMEPSERIKFSLASFFGRSVTSIWPISFNRMRLAA